MQTLIVVLGPTGVGKTELCLTIAEHLGCDIINCDSRQLFREIPIGTAAPTAEQQQRVRHHFVGTLSLEDYYSASEYEHDVMCLIENLKFLHEASGKAERKIENSRSQLSTLDSQLSTLDFQLSTLNSRLSTFILTGGSMMYIDAVCNGIDEMPTIDETLRQSLKDRLATEGLETLVEELHQLDPEYWAIVDKQNPRRILHALEICKQTGKTYTSLRTKEKKQRPFRIIKIGLTRPREELYERINQRVLKMIDDGLEQEARAVYPKRHLNSLNTVGYKEMFSYFDGKIPFEEAVRQIQSNSRRYMRKQETWFKRDTEIKWFHPDDVKQIIKYIDSQLNFE